MSSLSNWTNGNDAIVVADDGSFPIWSDWGASQRDLFILDYEGNIVLQQNISSGLPDSLAQLVIDLIADIPSDTGGGDDCICTEEWDPVCAVGGDTYSNECFAECDNADISYYGECCETGDVNNENPCNPMECYNGEWFEIVIDCAEQMGVPCEGGEYVDPPEDVCCSACIQYGDINNDSLLNVLDVVLLVNGILQGTELELSISDINGDGTLNVLDVVLLVNTILNP